MHSVEEAIEDHAERERQYENLVFSAANLNRPVQKCGVCKLDHAPLKPDLLAIRANKKEAKREKKREDIKLKLLQNVHDSRRVKE